MNEKPESDEFEDEEPTDVIGTEDVDVERVLRDMDLGKKRDHKAGDPVWRRLERLREDKRTAELTVDFEDYDIGVDGDAGDDNHAVAHGSGGPRRKRTRQ